MYGMFNSEAARKLSVRERFQLLRDAGFHGVEMTSALDQAEVLAARDALGLEIPSVVGPPSFSSFSRIRVSSPPSSSEIFPAQANIPFPGPKSDRKSTP
jgi:hypothetical protein